MKHRSLSALTLRGSIVNVSRTWRRYSPSTRMNSEQSFDFMGPIHIDHVFRSMKMTAQLKPSEFRRKK